jgi:hypothetical protein
MPKIRAGYAGVTEPESIVKFVEDESPIAASLIASRLWKLDDDD